MHMSKIKPLLKKLKDLHIEIEKISKEENFDPSKDIRRQLLSSQIKAYRIEQKLTQSELANKLGVGKLSVIRWESARRSPSALAMDRLKSMGIVR